MISSTSLVGDFLRPSGTSEPPGDVSCQSATGISILNAGLNCSRSMFRVCEGWTKARPIGSLSRRVFLVTDWTDWTLCGGWNDCRPVKARLFPFSPFGMFSHWLVLSFM